MRVKVKAFASLGEIVGQESLVDLGEGSTVKSLLERLCSAHPDLQETLFDSGGKIREDVTLLRNRTGVESVETVLEEEDEIALLPAFSGG